MSGRPRVHASAAEKQRAYRERLKASGSNHFLPPGVSPDRLLQVLRTAQAGLIFPGDQEVLAALIQHLDR